MSESRGCAVSETVQLAFCEPANAMALGKEHLRLLAPDASPTSVGLPRGTRALCGRDLTAGWDLPLAATREAIEHAASPRSSDGRVMLCSLCFLESFPHYGDAS